MQTQLCAGLSRRIAFRLMPHFTMRTLIRVFWITAFLLATFSWMVLFQHGFGWQKFTAGVKQELSALGIGTSPAK
jgi:hypothetical protein